MDKQSTEELRKKYMQNPPEGMTRDDVKHMSDDDLLDMDYFLLIPSSISCAHLCVGFF